MHSQPEKSAYKSSANGSTKYWSARVTEQSDTLDIKEGIFTWRDPKRIAASLKKLADSNKRRSAEPYRSAMSMLIFYINRGGQNLDRKQRQVLEQAKLELRKLYGKDEK
ncbi:MAG TPA: DUF3175 domain-containing protein [Gammaproteobacteria bacterium]